MTFELPTVGHGFRVLLTVCREKSGSGLSCAGHGSPQAGEYSEALRRGRENNRHDGRGVRFPNRCCKR
jgi:hypothetical protein